MDRIFRLKRVVILTTLFSFKQKNISFRECPWCRRVGGSESVEDVAVCTPLVGSVEQCDCVGFVVYVYLLLK